MIPPNVLDAASLGRNLATADARMTGPDGRLIASGRGVYLTRPRD